MSLEVPIRLRAGFLLNVWCVGLLTAGCGPAEEGARDAFNAFEAGSDASVEVDAGFVRSREYPGYCRGFVHRDRNREADAVELSRYRGTKLVTRDYDSDRDGEIERTTGYQYDDRDRLVLRQIDNEVDGTIDKSHHYEYDDADRRTEERIDRDGDGSIDFVIRFEHDETGRRIRGEGRPRDGGELRRVIEYEWSEDGELDLLAIDGLRGAPDGRADRLIDYLYDGFGNLVEGRFDYDANGRADVVVFYTYRCWRNWEFGDAVD